MEYSAADNSFIFNSNSMEPEVIKFIKKLLFFIIILILVDYVFGSVLSSMYFSQTKGQFAQTTTSIEDTNQDILIFGSSRAVRHYSPEILSNAFKMSCYNVGRDAQMIPYYTALQHVIFARYKPKMVILDINSWELSPGSSKYEKLAILLPYALKHPELNKYIAEGDEYERIKLYSKTYPYNSSLFILGYNYIFSNKVPADKNGYVPLIGEMTDAALKDHIRRMKISEDAKSEVGRAIDQKALNYYIKFLANTFKSNIKTYVVISPTILKEPVSYNTKKLIEEASKFKNVKFINFSSDARYNFKYQKFADVFHLNKKGSEEFTKDLIKHLN